MAIWVCFWVRGRQHLHPPWIAVCFSLQTLIAGTSVMCRLPSDIPTQSPRDCLWQNATFRNHILQVTSSTQGTPSSRQTPPSLTCNSSGRRSLLAAKSMGKGRTEGAQATCSPISTANQTGQLSSHELKPSPRLANHWIPPAQIRQPYIRTECISIPQGLLFSVVLLTSSPWTRTATEGICCPQWLPAPQLECILLLKANIQLLPTLCIYCILNSNQRMHNKDSDALHTDHHAPRASSLIASCATGPAWRKCWKPTGS